VGKSLSWIRIRSPILKGKEKKSIIPAVTLLKIDHTAKKATPITANAEEINQPRSSILTPQKKLMTNKPIALIKKLMYLNIKRVLLGSNSPILPTLLIVLYKIKRIKRKIAIAIMVCTNCCWMSCNITSIYYIHILYSISNY